MAETILKYLNGRAFLQPERLPANNPIYLGCVHVGGYTNPLGDVTPIFCPSDAVYGKREIVDTTEGEPGLPTTTVEARFGLVNDILGRRCLNDLDVHYGLCKDPQDYNGGWDIIIKFEASKATEESSGDLTMIEGDNTPIMITANFTARYVYEIKHMTYSEKAAPETDTEVLAVAICDAPACGECGWSSDGCKHLFAATAAVAGSPYDLPELLESKDGGATWDEWDIDTLHDADVSGIACVGSNMAVVSDGSTSLHYAAFTDLDTWVEVPNVFTAGAEPLAIFALSPTKVWIVGQNGYVYFTDDITDPAAYEVQDAGVAAASEDLLDVHASSSLDVVAVGVDGTVIRTSNGGLTWAATAASPTASDIYCVWMRSKYLWFVGAADGFLYYTSDGGATWTLKPFLEDGDGIIHDIVFFRDIDSSVGFLAYTKNVAGGTTEGRIYRTINNGNSWYQAPEDLSADVPANLGLTALAVCDSPNFLLAGGLRAGTDGIVVVGA